MTEPRQSESTINPSSISHFRDIKVGVDQSTSDVPEHTRVAVKHIAVLTLLHVIIDMPEVKFYLRWKIVISKTHSSVTQRSERQEA